MNDALKCGDLIPDTIRDDVPSATLGGNSQGALGEFGVTQTARLGQANDEKKTGFSIVDKCEAAKAEAIRKLTARSLWQRITPWRE